MIDNYHSPCSNFSVCLIGHLMSIKSPLLKPAPDSTHSAFFIAGPGYWYWMVLIRHGENEGYASASLSLLSTLMHTGLLGALITFAPPPLYATYIETQGSVDMALQDQQLAGLLMWIPVGAVYLIGGLAFVAAWLGTADRNQERRLHERQACMPPTDA